MKKSVTYAEIFELYCQYAEARLRSYKEIVGMHNRYLKSLESRNVSRLTRLELQQLHNSIGLTAGKTAANRAIELISAVINYSIDVAVFPGPNPATRIKKFKLKSRTRFLSHDEIEALLKAADNCKSTNVRDFIYLSIYTGARCGNIMTMKWEDLDFDSNLWIAPESKNDEPYYCPLVDQAVEILKNRRENSSSIYVFPGPKNGPMTHPRETWCKILKRAGLSGIRIHDLRRNLGSWQAKTGSSLAIIGKTLNHKDPKSTLIYARLDLAPVRSAMEKAIDAMRSA